MSATEPEWLDLPAFLRDPQFALFPADTLRAIAASAQNETAATGSSAGSVDDAAPRNTHERSLSRVSDLQAACTVEAELQCAIHARRKQMTRALQRGDDDMTNLLDQQQEFRRIVDEAKREGKLLSVPEEYSCVGVPGVGSLQPGTQCWSSGVPLISQQPWHPGIVRVKWEQRHLLTKLEWPQVRVIAVRPVYGYAYGPHAHDEFYHAPATDGGPSFQGFDLRIESPYCTPKVPYEQMYVENIDQFLDRLPKEGP